MCLFVFLNCSACVLIRDHNLTSSHDCAVNSHYFFLSVSIKNRTATEDKIMAVLRSSEGQNYQSKYLDLPSQNEQSSSSTERIINGYDFLAVNERMEESLVVLAMLAQIPLADVVVFSAKTAGGYYYKGALI